MKLLLKAALKNTKHLLLLFIAILFMWVSTFSIQMERFALGVLSQKGADFFELFAPDKNIKEVSRQDIEDKWQIIDPSDRGVISIKDANSYLSSKDGGNLFNKTLNFIDSYLKISDDMVRLMALLAIVAIFIALSSFGNNYFTQLVAIRISRDMRQDYFQHIQSLPLSFYQKHNIGSLSSRVVGDAGFVATAINSVLINYLQTPFTIVTTLFICFYLSVKLSLIIFFGLPIIIIPIVFLAKKIKSISKQMQKNQEGFAAVLIDFLSGIQTVKAFAMEDFSLKKYQEQNDWMAKLDEKSARYSFSTRPITHMFGTLFLVTIILYALYGLRMSLPEVLVYCGMVHLFYEPIKKFAEENNNIQRGVAAAERMYEVLELKPDIQDAPDAIELMEFKDKIEFDDVWFRYGDEWILKGVSFTVAKGEFIALVGPTGAGKSTIAQLILRLYEVERGEIRIDGLPLQAYSQKSVREAVAFVPQAPFLFLDTIAKNISFGRDFSKEAIEEAAKKAHADEFIAALPAGYDTMLAERGKNLSGGQQQRLAIARALVKAAPILLLDEPTSSLDSVSENRIKIAVQSLQSSVTQIIIAHRLSTIENADKIIYLEKGKKVAEGNKDALVQSCPNFKMMWDMMYVSTEE